MNKIIWLVIVVVLIVGGIVWWQGKEGSEYMVEPPPDNSFTTPPAPVSETTNDDQMATPEPAIPEVKEFTITGQNFSFAPNTITVNQGDRVRIIFKNTDGFHDLKIDEFSVGTKQFRGPGEEAVEFTADKTGSFEYYCSVGEHRQMGMKGTLVVN